jgi:hypothetical protein
MVFYVPSSTKSTVVNTVTDEKFVKIYISNDNEEVAQLLDNGRTFMNVKLLIFACALGIHSYSSGIHRIRIRVDKGYPFLDIRSRNIPPKPAEYAGGRHSFSPSTHGWGRNYVACVNGEFSTRSTDEINRDGHVYTLTLNCDERRLSIINENTNEQREMEVDICHAPFPWCLFVELPRMRAQVSLI